MKIFKYPLRTVPEQDIEMPKGAAVLSLQVQPDSRGSDTPQVWALVDPDEPKILRRFRTYATGEEMEDHADFPHFVGTYQLSMGAFVAHVFTDRVERPVKA